MRRERVCARCGKSTRGKEWVEAAGLRICMDCVHKRAAELSKCICDPEINIPNRFCSVHGTMRRKPNDNTRND